MVRLLGLMVLVALMHTTGPQCPEKSIEKREEDANIVVSGLVDRIMREPKQMTYSCEVKVIRIFKGGNHVGDDMEQDNMIMVKGFGNPHLCENTAHKGDVRILMINQDSQGQYSLNSSLVRITIGNLDHAEAAVSDIPFATRQPVTQAPCMRIICGFGAICQLNENHDPICVCPDACADIYTPVCGSDGITYFSECTLLRHSCIESKLIRKVSDGPCSEEFGNPCDNKNCEFGAECMLTQDGSAAKCVCPQDCDLSDHSVVCGSDGTSYSNECSLTLSGCVQKKSIEVVYKGECNPCEQFRCSPGVCGIDEDRSPYCRCDMECDQLPKAEVCANDWKIYNNTCEIEKAACESHMDLFPLNNGECYKVENPCLNWVCPFSPCIVDVNGDPMCACPVCADIYEPVCSTDGNTYHSECQFDRERCVNAIEMAIVSEGECVTDKAALCLEHLCDFGYCIVEGGKPVCKCDMMCPVMYKPVCGSDGMSYGSGCELYQAACELKMDIVIAYEGLCEGCEQHECEYGAICEMTIDGPKCVCSEGCIEVQAPVCGSDGVTYSNECVLRVEACKTEANTSVASLGLCDECADVTCEFGAECDRGMCQCQTVCPLNFQPICGEDGKTYDNECSMKLASCETKKNILKDFDGRCEQDGDDEDDFSGSGSGSGYEGSGLGSGSGEDDGSGKRCDTRYNCFYGTCEQTDDEFGRCSCKFRCPLLREPVCGSDGKTYASECNMREHSCKSSKYIAATKYSSCEEDFGACDGETPLKRPGTNKDLYCGPEEGSDTCPEKSYCHTNTEKTFAKCCPEEKTHGCTESMYGCCPDGKTSARGTNFAGCPSLCKCNELGSYRRTCDPTSFQCSCKPGVGGSRCDRCEPGFWDFRGIQNGNSGCRACSCQPGGSIRDDCHQMTGQCLCKESVMGMKCDICPFEEVMTSSGCELLEPGQVVKSCDELECRYGCSEARGVATCKCPVSCPDVGPVCGSDGATYASECMLDLVACRTNQNLRLVSREKCKKPPPCPSTNCQVLCPRGFEQDENGCQTCKCIAEPTTSPDIVTETPEVSSESPEVSSESPDVVTTKSEIVTMAPENITMVPEDVTMAHEDMSTTPMQTQPGKLLTADMSTLEPDEMATTIIEGVTYRTELVTEYPKEVTGEPKMETDGQPSKTDQFFTSNMIVMETSTLYETVTIDIDKTEKMVSGKTLKATEESKLEVTPEPLIQTTLLATEVVTERVDMGPIPTSSEKLQQQTTGFGMEPTKMSTEIVEKDVTETVEKDVTEAVGKDVTETLEKDVTETLEKDVTETLERDVTEKTEIVTEKVIATEMSNVRVTKNIPVTTMPSDDEDLSTEMGSGTGEDLEQGGTTPVLMTNIVGTTVMPLYTGSGCEMTKFGCCEDGITPSDGPDGMDCPLVVTTPEPPPPACDSVMCQHGGSCINRMEEPGFICLCPLGRNGPVCEEETEYTTPSFSGHSYIAFEKRRRTASSTEIEVEFYPESDTGILFYSSSSDGDEFISIEIVDGFVEFRWQGKDDGIARTTIAMPTTDNNNDFDVGFDNLLVLRSTESVSVNEWHTVVAMRERRDGSLQVDDQAKVSNRLGSGSSLLILETDVFVGGIPLDQESTYDHLQVSSGLVGCVRKLSINDEPYQLKDDALYGASVGECGVSPCDAKPCLNNATCIKEGENFMCKCVEGFFGPLCGDIFVDPCEGNLCRSGSTCVTLPEGGYRCDCPIGLQGEKCEEEVVEEVYIPAFSGISYIERPGLKNLADQTSMNISFLTKAKDGMILYNGQKGSNRNGDFISLNMVNGFLEFRYDLGGGEANIKSETPLSMNEFHDVYVTRNRRNGMMVIDNGTPVSGKSKGTQSQLNLGGNLFIGGSRDFQFATRARITTGLTGAIDKFMVRGEMVDDLLEGAINIVEVTNYQDDVCKNSPCMDGYMCMKNVTTYACVCPPGKFDTENGCASEIDPGMVSDVQTTQKPTITPSNNIIGLDGNTTLAYPSGGKIRVKAARSSQIELDVRTVNKSGVILWNGQDNGKSGDFLAIAIINGLPEFSYNLGSGTLRIKSNIPINDGQWHRIYAMRNLREGSLQVDEDEPILDTSKAASTQLDTNGLLILGGVDSLSANAPSEYRNMFVGCVKNVQIVGNNLKLVDDAIGQKPTQFCSEN
ncbi:agrin-like isoform X3 [Antedon mediterranea]|uniref:agrin-like isoform X3 n=1 Tax=Antedon mediterranea TaxID=105859 RepID=UPI003AF7534A